MGAQMPRSVAWYERISYAAIALAVATLPLHLGTVEKYYHQHPVGYPIGLAIAFLVQVFWVWLVARRHRDWTRWASIVLSSLALLDGLWRFHQRLQEGVAAAVAFYGICLLFCVAAGLLFTPSATPWFKSPANL